MQTHTVPATPQPRELSFWLYAAILLALVTGVYLSGLGNELIFDDRRLEDGTIFGRYGSLLEFRQRMLSYGSFVWIQDGLGDGWWKQRAFNLLLHLGVVGALYAFTQALLDSADFDDEITQQAHFAASRRAAVWVGVTVFALNPVAVYAVAYLIQRSIVMATLFTVLAAWAFVRGLQSGRWAWHVLALACYVLGVLSKEYAAMAAAFTVPLYLYIRRPGLRQTVIIAGVAALLLAGVAGLFWGLYGHLIGKVFDPKSQQLVQQLESMRPGISEYVYPLSILNEAALFFRYGLLWFIPNVQWMAIDLRPAFPLRFLALPQLAGTIGYLGLLSLTTWVVLRRKGPWALAALLLLMPLLAYVTEFATVWIQDPFVLYRSYLWAIAIPGLVALVLIGLKPRTVYLLGMVLALGLTALSWERVASLRDAGSAWGDAVAKLRPDAPANALDRSRPHLNLGEHLFKNGHIEQALHEFATADALGDVGGKARFNIGTMRQQQNRHAEALQSFDTAYAKGYRGQSLDIARAESAHALGQFERAYDHFDAALNARSDLADQVPLTRQLLRLRRAEMATATNRFDVAAADYTALLQDAPGNPRLQHGLAMAWIGQGKHQRAIALFDELISSSPTPAAFYGRALAHHYSGQRQASLDDMRQAVRMEPQNPQYRNILQQMLAAAEEHAAPNRPEAAARP